MSQSGSFSLTWQRRRSKPKRLRLEESRSAEQQQHQHQQQQKDIDVSDNSNDNANDSVKDAYEFNQLEFYNSLYLRRNVRPLPAISAMLAIAPQHQQQQQQREDLSGSLIGNTTRITRKRAEPSDHIPLLNDFYNSFDFLHKSTSKSASKMIKDGSSDNNVDNNNDNDNGTDDDDDDNNNNNNEIPKNAEKTSSLLDNKNKEEGDSNDKTLDQYSTILTHGHHKRFRELLSELEKDGLPPNHKQRKQKAFRDNNSNNIIHNQKQQTRQKEFKKLCDLFGEERRLYAIALEKYQIDNTDKFLTGFRIPGPASGFVHVNAEKVKQWNKRWQNAQKPNIPSNIYGPYTQAISLQSTISMGNDGGGDNGNANTNYMFDSLGVNTFKPTIVYRETNDGGDGLPILKNNWIETSLQRKRRLRPRIITEPISTLLCNDDVAKSLALKHNVDIVLTSDTFEVLLQHPEAVNTRWTIPLSYIDVDVETTNKNKSLQKLVLFLEDPLPCISTPRECLSVGIKEALIGHQVMDAMKGSTTSTSKASNDGRIKGKNTYTLLSIPNSTGKQRVLIRSVNYLIDENEKPVILLSKLEYFSAQRGLEEFNTHDNAVWLMHKMLQEDCRIVVGRVDAISAEILYLEEKTIADALTTHDVSITERYLDSLGRFEAKNEASIKSLFHIMSTILSAVQLIEKKTDARHIVCLPGQSDIISPRTTATIHKAQIDGSNISVDINKELNENAASVQLHKNTLLSCFNKWQWNHNRLPYTFPLQDKE